MAKPRVLVLRAPGTNCDVETAFAFEMAGAEAVSIHVRGLGMDREVGKALVNYSAIEVDRIKGRHSDEIESLLGYSDTEYVAHRDNLAFFSSG